MKKVFVMALCLLCLGACKTADSKTSESDPYSYVVKAYSQLDVNSLYELSEEDFAQGFQMRPEYAFNNLGSGLFAYYDANGNLVYENLYYAFYDIDGNGTEELLLGAGRQPGYAGLIEVYSILDGVAVQQAFGLSYCSDCGTEYPSLLKNGTIWSIHSNMEEESSYYYYCFEEGQLKLQMKLARRMTYDDYENSHYGNVFFRSDVDDSDSEDIPISYEEYGRLREKFEGDGQGAEIVWKPLADYMTR